MARHIGGDNENSNSARQVFDKPDAAKSAPIEDAAPETRMSRRQVQAQESSKVSGKEAKAAEKQMRAEEKQAMAGEKQMAKQARKDAKRSGKDKAGDMGEEFITEQPRKKKKGPVVAVILVVVLLAVGGYFAYDYFFGGMLTSKAAETMEPGEEKTFLFDNGTIYRGVSVMGIDVSGMTTAEAIPLVNAKVEQTYGGVSKDFTVNGKEYHLTNQDLGISMNAGPAMEEAVLYGREGSIFERQEEIKAIEQGVDVPVAMGFDPEVIRRAVEKYEDDFYVAPVNASVETHKTKDEGSLTTGLEISFTEGTPGWKVDTDKLVNDIYTAVSNGDYSAIDVQPEVLQPEISKSDLEGIYTERGTFSTKYSSSSDNRRYNIWKMADVINGVTIQPGDDWSINEEAGPRTFDLGWRGAPGISNGEYKEEAGGGICQVSSTLYGAVLRAEVKVVDRSHHSWPLDYIAGGLDATISTGAPDFVIRNNYDVPIVIKASCDGYDSATIRISILGPPHSDGLTRDFSSELIDEFGGGGATIVTEDPSRPAGTQETIIKEHMGKKYRVTKHWVDSDGNTVKSEEYSIETYNYMPAKIIVGTGAAVAPPPAEDPGVVVDPAPVDPEPVPEPEPAPVDDVPPAEPE